VTTTIRRWRWAVTGVVAAAFAGATLGVSLAEAQAPPAPAKGKAASKPARGRNRPVAPHLRKAPPVAGDPLAKKAGVAGVEEAKKDAAAGTYHFKLRIDASDNVRLGVSFYPAVKPDTSAPVVLLVHEKDRSDKDFEDPIRELQNKGLAEHLQKDGYAVLTFDLRGHGTNRRQALTDRDWREMVDDLQSVYQFLLDRHNRGEFNIAKLGVVAVGEGSNLAAAWAHQPGGAVSSEGRVTDLSALAFVSPLPAGVGFSFPTLINALAPRIPVLLMVGERDALSSETVKKLRANVEKTRQNKVELFPTSLHGYKLIQLEPKTTTALDKFLEATVKQRAVEWEPRYNLDPTPYSDIQIVRHTPPAKDAPKEKDAAKEKAAAEEKDAAEKADAKKKADAEEKPAPKARPKDAARPKARPKSAPK
jgi:alpha-beta hydrolase superfamily lysophospholipase